HRCFEQNTMKIKSIPIGVSVASCFSVRSGGLAETSASVLPQQEPFTTSPTAATSSKEISVTPSVPVFPSRLTKRRKPYKRTYVRSLSQAPNTTVLGVTTLIALRRSPAFCRAVVCQLLRRRCRDSKFIRASSALRFLVAAHEQIGQVERS